MRPNPVTFTEEMLNGHLYAVSISKGRGENLMLLKGIEDGKLMLLGQIKNYTQSLKC